MVLHHTNFMTATGIQRHQGKKSLWRTHPERADAYEAMTSDRPYRRSLTQDAALEILVNGKGKQFDPKMVDIFQDILRSGQQQGSLT